MRGQTLAALRAERDNAESRAYRGLLSALYAEDHPYRFPLVGTRSERECLHSGRSGEFSRAVLALRARRRSSSPATSTPKHWPPLLNERLPASRAPAPAVSPIEPPMRRLRPSSGPARPARGTPGAWCVPATWGSLGPTPTSIISLVLNQILGGQFTSRLNTKLREERGFTYGVRSHFDCRRQPGPFSITTSVQADRLAEALDDIHHELEALTGDRPPSQIELDNARRALVEGQARHFETPSALVNRCANLVIHGLPVDHEAGFADRLAAIDLDSLTAVARQRIHPDSLVAIVVADADLVVENLKRLEWASLERIDG